MAGSPHGGQKEWRVKGGVELRDGVPAAAPERLTRRAGWTDGDSARWMNATARDFTVNA